MTWITKGWLWLAGLLAVAVIVGMACGGDDSTATKTPGGTATTAQLKTDVGVSATEITLGTTIVQSGSLAAVYQPVVPTLQAYFAKVNAEDSGVCGRKIVLKAEDDQYSPALGLEKAKKLIEQDKVLALVGDLGTPPVTGQVAYVNEQKVPMLFVSTGATKWGDYKTYPYTIGYIPDYTSEGKILGQYFKDHFAGKKVAVLYQNDDFGKNGRDGFKGSFGADFVAEQSYEATATDISSQLANLKSATPDVLYLYSTPAFTAKAFGYMKANAWTPQVVESYVNSATTLASLVGGGSDAAKVQAGFAAIAGTISTNYILDPIADATNPAMVEHKRIMEKYSGPPLGSLSVYAQSLAELMVKTLQVACTNGDMTRQGVLKAAESIKAFRTSLLLPGIQVDLSATDHFALQALMPVSIQSTGVLKALADKPIAAQ